jgi:uncharacterized protein (TIGR03067 family)
MKTSFLTLALVCIALFSLAADIPKTNDQQNLQGEWIAESATANGVKVEDAAGFQYIFREDKLTISNMIGKEVKYSFKIDASSKPKLLVLQPLQALTNATMCSAAYELNGAILKVVIGNPGTRPTEMSDKDQILTVLKRKKIK